jgi:DNA-binding NarL/FixJ family response regulator
LGEAEFDLALIDLNYARDTTSGREGLDLLARLQAADPTLPVVVTTAWGTVDLAVEAMRRGALQCLILRRGLRLAVVGIALGLIGALATTRLLRGPDGGAADGVRSLRPPVGPVP